MIVIDTDMPKNCTECPLYSSGLGVDFCTLASHGCVDRVNYNPSIKPQWCPIKCDIEDIKAGIDREIRDIEKNTTEFGNAPVRFFNKGIRASLKIIDKHMRGDTDESDV